MSTRLAHLKSKLKKTAIMLKSHSLRKYVPATRTFTFQNAMYMLKKYKVIYIKPDRGSYGKGVMKAQTWKRNGKTEYRLQYKRNIFRFDSAWKMYAAAKTIARGRRYIVQRGIELLTFGSRPFDIRVMVQQSPARKWETTGMLARIASPGQIVTNYHSGGTPVEVDRVLSLYMTQQKVKTMKKNLAQLGLQTAKHVHKHVPNLKEAGLDVALDPKLRAWILEVNTRPDAFVFRRLKHKAMFKKIYRYAQHYGKYKKRRK